jgi:hypothetical protein
VARLARGLRFIGRIEYRHVYSQTGGAQYGRGTAAEEDLLTVYAEAFERDADPEDFSLAAIIAHERGHQVLARHPCIARRAAGVSAASEEILASLLGAMLCKDDTDRVTPSASGTVGPIGGPAMIGTKKLGTIRREIEEALAPAGGDPIQRLERQIAAAKRKGDRTEVMEGLKRLLESPRKRKRRKGRAGARKGRRQAR